MKYLNKRACIYARIDAPEDYCCVLRGQEKELMDYAECLGISVVCSYSDLNCGASDEQPGLDAVINDARDSKFDVLLVQCLSRLGRDKTSVLPIIEELESNGVEVLSPQDGNINSLTLNMYFPGGSGRLEGRHYA